MGKIIKENQRKILTQKCTNVWNKLNWTLAKITENENEQNFND